MFGFCKKLLIIFSFITLISSYSVEALACEPAASPTAATAGANGSISAAVTAASQTIINAADIVYAPLMEYWVLFSLFQMKKSIFKKVDWLWTKWDTGLKTMMKQIASGAVDESKDFGYKEDIKNLNIAKTIAEMEEAKAKRQYQPNNQGCGFDTDSKYLNRSDIVKKAMSSAYSSDFSKIGSSEKGSDASTGELSFEKKRWEAYSTKFCDVGSNNGQAGCDASLSASNPNANKNTMPSKLLFANETIDMTDPVNREALKELIFNITGYKGSDAVVTSAMKASAGLEQRQKGREYMTQMDAVGALIYSIVAERTPSDPAPEIVTLREKIGVTNASATPSSREIRQAIIEQLWDPNYYKELYDAPATIPQKEIYLKAYSLIMLNDLIEKQEKISNVFAIETANILESINVSKGSASSGASLR